MFVYLGIRIFWYYLLLTFYDLTSETAGLILQYDHTKKNNYL